MWTLLLSHAADPPNAYFDRRQLDSGEIVVGRSAKTCDLVLPDEQGFVSRRHCTISARGLDVFVVDISAKNGVALNHPDARIAPHVAVPVRPDDRLFIGDFVITLKTESAAAGISLGAQAPPPLPMQRSSLDRPDPWMEGPSGSIWGDEAPPSAVHEFLGNAMNDFLSPGPASSSPAPAPAFDLGDPFGQAFSRPILAEPLPAPADFGIPEDWATASVGGQGGAAAFEAPPPALPAFDDHLTPISALPPEPSPAAGRFDLDEPSHDPPPPATAVEAERPAPSRAGSQAGPYSGEVWDAFFEGAGLDPEELRLAPDAMRRLGVLYRQTVLGLSDIIQDRASFKDEFRVERTQLSMGRNNPLKYLPPLEAAKALLGDLALPGFMDSDEAVRTAFEDIKKHQLAMLAGVQQALIAVFDRLSPAEIDRMVEKAAASRKGLSFGRGIDRWSVYQTLFEALRKDATSNANGVMSVAFREGYEKFLKSA